MWHELLNMFRYYNQICGLKRKSRVLKACNLGRVGFALFVYATAFPCHVSDMPAPEKYATAIVSRYFCLQLPVSFFTSLMSSFVILRPSKFPSLRRKA